MSKNSQMKKLLLDNRELMLGGRKSGLCVDGIVDEDIYDKESLKVAFLLKDPNGNNPENVKIEDREDWLEYREWLNKIAYEKNPEYKFNYIGMWMQMLDAVREENTNELYDNVFFDGVSEACAQNGLKRVVIINLKKTWGAAATDLKELYEYMMNKDRQKVIREQLNISDAKLVICGGKDVVFGYAKDIYGTKEEVDGRLKYFEADGKVFVDFYHPKVRGSRKKYYDFAEEVFTKLFELKLI